MAGLTYYQLGQASRFIEPGARRIGSEHFVAYGYHPAPVGTPPTPGLDDVALENPDGSRVLLAYNGSSVGLRFAVRWRRREFTYTLAPAATVTFVWRGTRPPR